MKPWAEKSITLDLFAYHGMSLLDNGTNAGGAACDSTAVAANISCAQRDSTGVLGGSIRAQLGSAILTSGLQFEHHDKPYQGTPASADGTTPAVLDSTSGDAWVQYNELDYVIFPWLVPGVRTELTTMSLEPGGNAAGSSHASLFRLIPGVATLIRPNIKLVVTGDLEYAYGMPVTGSWGPALGSIVAPSGQGSKIEAETLTATVAIAF